jgi:uncharacterized membrane protein
MSLVSVLIVTIAGIGVFAAGWALVGSLVLPRFGVWLLYIQIWIIALLVVWVGIVLALAGWVVPKLLDSDATHVSATQKILSAATAAVLLYVGKQLLELRHVQVAERVLESVFKFNFRNRVPRSLEEDLLNDAAPKRMAYRALYFEDFVIPSVAAIKGWGPNAACHRVGLIKSYIHHCTKAP